MQDVKPIAIDEASSSLDAPALTEHSVDVSTSPIDSIVTNTQQPLPTSHDLMQEPSLPASTSHSIPSKPYPPPSRRVSMMSTIEPDLSQTYFPSRPPENAFADFDEEDSSPSTVMRQFCQPSDATVTTPSGLLSKRSSCHSQQRLAPRSKRTSMVNVTSNILETSTQISVLSECGESLSSSTITTSPVNTIVPTIMEQPKRIHMGMSVPLKDDAMEECPPRTFMHGLMDFWETPVTFAMACVFPCVAYASHRNRLEKRAVMGKRKERKSDDERRRDENSVVSPCVSACLFTSLIPICGHVFLHTSLRSSLRTTYNIRGSSIDDTAVSCFCLPCALTQEQREIEAWDSAVADHRRSRQSILVLSGELNDLKEKRATSFDFGTREVRGIVDGLEVVPAALALEGITMGVVTMGRPKPASVSVSSGERTEIGS